MAVIYNMSMQNEIMTLAQKLHDKHNVPMSAAIEIVTDTIAIVSKDLISDDLIEFDLWKKSL